MPSFSFKVEVARDIVDIILKIIEPIGESLRGKLAYSVQAPEEEDEMMQDIWLQELQEILQDDCDALIKLLNNKKFGKEKITLEDMEMEPIIRACSAIRLKLHTRYLGSLKDAELESGEIDFMTLTPEERIHYSCYMFLAGLQNILIDHIDPESSEE